MLCHRGLWKVNPLIILPICIKSGFVQSLLFNTEPSSNALKIEWESLFSLECVICCNPTVNTSTKI